MVPEDPSLQPSLGEAHLTIYEVTPEASRGGGRQGGEKHGVPAGCERASRLGVLVRDRGTGVVPAAQGHREDETGECAAAHGRTLGPDDGTHLYLYLLFPF